MNNETEVIERLARIETQLANVAERVGTTSNHEARLAVLESRSGGWRSVLVVVAGVIGALGFVIGIADRLYA